MTAVDPSLAWPASRFAAALSALSQARGTEGQAALPAAPPLAQRAAFDRWLSVCGSTLKVRLEAVDVRPGQLAEVLTELRAGFLVAADGLHAFAVVQVKGQRVQLLGPQGQLVWALARDVAEAQDSAGVSAALARARETAKAAGLRGHDAEQAARALAGLQLEDGPSPALWELRALPSATLAGDLGEAGVWRTAALTVAAHLGGQLVFLAAWWVLGGAVVGGRLEAGVLAGGALLLATSIPLRAWTGALQGRVIVVAGGVVKRRLLDGAINLEPERIRAEGIGALLGRVLESEALEALALNGGLTAALATVELALGAGVLVLAPSRWVHLSVLGLVVAAALLTAKQLFDARGAWTESRLQLTRRLVEQLIGHRTRLAQGQPGALHHDDEQGLLGYLERSVQMDGLETARLGALPRVWLLLGLAALAPALLGPGVGVPALVAALGGVLLVFRALERWCSSLGSLVAAAISWRAVADVSAAAPGAGRRITTPLVPAAKATTPLVETGALSFRYPGAPAPAVHGCALTVRRGDHLLVEGPSGSGKSTLAALLCGLRAPQSGLLLINGVDHHSLPDAEWRAWVLAAPQFHHNHVFTGTLAFNLLMGRRWPPSEAELREAEALCEALGLGPLLARMPGGLQQLVGETGWQLSHGERSRVYIARALLQRPELLVLDESFAALDPENLQRALESVVARAAGLLVVAHP